MKTNCRLLTPVFFSRTFLLILAFTLGGVTLGTPRTANADTTANSSAFGEKVDVEVLPLLGSGIEILSGPLPLVSGSAPPAYTKSASVLTVTVAPILKTGLLTVNAESSVPGSTGVSADATVKNLELDLLGELLASLLTLDVDTIQSTATIGGTCGALTAKGTTTILGAVLGGQLGLGKAIAINPAPNTVLLNLLGVKVVLNEQILSGDGLTNRKLIVNAIHVYFNNAALNLGLLNGDIIISQSQAQLQCAPSVIVPKADLALTKTATPNPVKVGADLTYILTATNNGPDKATNVKVTDTLPDGATFISAVTSQGTCVKSGVRTVACSLGDLNKGATATIKIIVKITKVVNIATIKATEKDPVTKNNKARTETLLE